MKRPAVFACGAQAVAAFCLAAQSPPAAPVDSTFFLSSTDVARTPSPFIGNGRIGLVVPALGIGSAPSFMAGVYESAPTDVPRIVSIPSWTSLTISDGQRWLNPDRPAENSVDAYTQVLDMQSVLERIPIRLTPMREWLPQQDWLAAGRRLVGSVSG